MTLHRDSGKPIRFCYPRLLHLQHHQKNSSNDRVVSEVSGISGQRISPSNTLNSLDRRAALHPDRYLLFQGFDAPAIVSQKRPEIPKAKKDQDPIPVAILQIEDSDLLNFMSGGLTVSGLLSFSPMVSLLNHALLKPSFLNVTWCVRFVLAFVWIGAPRHCEREDQDCRRG